jgi:rubrerythrin
MSFQLSRSAAREAFADASRKIITLEGFAETETRGGRNIAAAAERAGDESLRLKLERHARDELRHGELFLKRAAELRAQTGEWRRREGGSWERVVPADRSAAPGPLDLDEHGFFDGHAFEDVGDVGYVAMLHVAERRAAEFFRKLRRDMRGDEATAAILDEVLNDEVRHVGYTGACLKQWSKNGRRVQVREALAVARGKRALGAWSRFAARVASRGGRVFTFLIYYTIAAPFGIIARLGHRERHGWRPPRAPRDPGHLRSQF